jgi:hypothetical protein
MFYTRENQSADSRGRLTRAILPVPNSTLWRITHCSYQQAYRAKLPRFDIPLQEPTGYS